MIFPYFGITPIYLGTEGTSESTIISSYSRKKKRLLNILINLIRIINEENLCRLPRSCRRYLRNPGWFEKRMQCI